MVVHPRSKTYMTICWLGAKQIMVICWTSSSRKWRRHTKIKCISLPSLVLNASGTNENRFKNMTAFVDALNYWQYSTLSNVWVYEEMIVQAIFGSSAHTSSLFLVFYCVISYFVLHSASFCYAIDKGCSSVLYFNLTELVVLVTEEGTHEWMYQIIDCLSPILLEGCWSQWRSFQ